MRAITELLKFLGVDESMMDSIHHYYEYKFANKCMFDEQASLRRPCYTRPPMQTPHTVRE